MWLKGARGRDSQRSSGRPSSHTYVYMSYICKMGFPRLPNDSIMLKMFFFPRQQISECACIHTHTQQGHWSQPTCCLATAGEAWYWRQLSVLFTVCLRTIPCFALHYTWSNLVHVQPSKAKQQCHKMTQGFLFTIHTAYESLIQFISQWDVEATHITALQCRTDYRKISDIMPGMCKHTFASQVTVARQEQHVFTTVQ